MARTCVYERVLDAILTGVTCGNSSLLNEVRVKIEPPDPDSEMLDDVFSIADGDKIQKETILQSENGGANVLQKHVFQEQASDKENEYDAAQELVNSVNQPIISKETNNGAKLNSRKHWASSECIEQRKVNFQEKRRSSLSVGKSSNETSMEQRTMKLRTKIVSANLSSNSKSKVNNNHVLSKRTNQKNFTCDECPMTFENEQNYLIHKLCYKSQNAAEYNCNTCNGWFITLNELQQHGSCKSDVGKYTLDCSFCPKRFKLPHRLQSHLFHLHRDSITSGAVNFLKLRNNVNVIIASKSVKKSYGAAQKKSSEDEDSIKKLSPKTSNPTSVSEVSPQIPNADKEKTPTRDCKSDRQRTDMKDEVVNKPEQRKLATLVENSVSNNSATKAGISEPDTTPGEIRTNVDRKAQDRVNTEGSSPPKKMKQLTLMEFLQLSSKKKEASTPVKSREEEIVLSNPAGKDPRVNAKAALFQEENQENVSPRLPNQSFVRIHADMSLLMSLLDNSSIKSEPVDSPGETSNVSVTPYRLRQTIKRNSRKECSTVAKSRSKHKKRPKIQCKECYIPLVRCDVVTNKNVATPATPSGKTVSSELNLSSLQTIPIKRNLQSRSENKTNPVRSPLKNVESPLFKLNNNTASRNVTPNETNAASPSGTAESVVRAQLRDLLPCKICKKTFSSKETLREHIKLSHVTYMSSICDARYSSRSKLLRHYLREHAAIKRNECCVCEEMFNNTIALTRHMILHCIKTIRSNKDKFPIDVEVKCNAFKKQHKCPTCGRKFWLKSCLRKHQSISHAKRSEARVEQDTLQQEKTVSTSPKKPGTPSSSSITVKLEGPLCTVGDKTVSKSLDVSPDWAAQSNKIVANNFESEVCADKAENEKETALTNSLNVVDIDKTTYSCAICGKQFRTFRNLCLHQRSYSQPACDQCSICGTTFTTKRMLQHHIAATHTTPEISQSYKFHCKFCNQGFLKKINLRSHEMHFHAQQPHMTPVRACLNQEQVWNVSTICTVCNLMFEDYDRFVEHNMYYFKDHVFLCTFCSRSFNGMYMLHHHNKLTHYPEVTRNSYPYVCNVCSEGFNHESHFHAHKLHVHPTEFYVVPSIIAEMSEQNLQMQVVQ